ncbi:hypothetical protein AgCh_028470 [Apium graveolens]
MVNETADVHKIVETGSGSGGTTTIDWTTYRFPHPIDLSGQPILPSLENTLFDVYSSDVYTAKVLWDKLDQTHNTDSQGFEKYSVARFLDFKLVDGKSMTEQVHEFEMLVHDLSESGGRLTMSWYPQSYVNNLNMTNMNMRPDPATGYPGQTYREHRVLVEGAAISERYKREKAHTGDFWNWMKEEFGKKEDISKELKLLAMGPNRAAKRFSEYVINGYRFYTKYRDSKCTT